MKRILSLVLALTMLLTAAAFTPVALAADAPMEIEWYFDDTNPPTDDDWFRTKLEDTFGVTLKPIVRNGAEQRAWYDQEIAAGNRFDVYMSGGLMLSDYDRYIEAGLVREISRDMIEQNMPNYTAWAEKYAADFGGDLIAQYEKDGKLYCIPTARVSDQHRNVLGIRQDWLDNLGLDVPETIEEFEEVMRAFTEDDPDGNGKDDTYGLTGVNWVSFAASGVTMAYDVLLGEWYERDGQVCYGYTDPNAKKAIELLSRWYKAGYIVPGFLEQDWEAFRSDLYNSRAGMGVQFYMNFLPDGDSWMLPDLLQITPNASFAISAGVMGEDGSRGCQQFSATPFAGMMFGYDVSDELVAKYMQIFDTVSFDAQWLLAANFGEENVGYTIDGNGLPVRIEEGASVAPAAHMVANEISPFFQEPENDRLYKYATELAREGDKEGFATAQGFYTLSFPVAREKWDNYSTALNEITNEYVMELIKGERPIDDFDKMVEEWMNAGGREVMEEAQAIYDTYMK